MSNEPEMLEQIMSASNTYVGNILGHIYECAVKIAQVDGDKSVILLSDLETIIKVIKESLVK